MLLLAYASALAEARSYLAALSDAATAFDASIEYDRVLLQLDAVHGDDTPALYAVSPATRQELHVRAETTLAALSGFGVDGLQVELLLARLEDARGLDVP